MNADYAPKRPVWYMFQHVTIPEAAFTNHPELLRDLSGENTFMPLLHCWSKAQLRCVSFGLIAFEHLSFDTENMNPDAQFPREGIKIHSVKSSGYTFYGITMPPPEHAPEAYYTAIVHKDDEPKDFMRPSPSTRYFTLERDDQNTHPFFCEWKPGGHHLNYGQILAPDLREFGQAVFEKIVS